MSGEQFFTEMWPIIKRCQCAVFAGVTGLSGPPYLFLLFIPCNDPSYREKQVYPFNFPHQEFFQESHSILKIVECSRDEQMVVEVLYRP